MSELRRLLSMYACAAGCLLNTWCWRLAFMIHKEAARELADKARETLDRAVENRKKREGLERLLREERDHIREDESKARIRRERKAQWRTVN